MTIDRRATADPQVEESAERIARRPWPTAPLHGTPTVSFEFFPPATAEADDALLACVNQLQALQPRFVSVTYGAGGASQHRTQATITRLTSETDLAVAGHLTCVAATKATTDSIIDAYLDAGIRHIVALRGDAPSDGSGAAVAEGYRDAAELVAAIRRRSDEVEISVAAYPEVHPLATSADADLDNLKRKIDAGADRALTQFFFDNDVFFRFLDRCRQADITSPIVPGIMPVTNFAGVCRFAARCGTTIPEWMADLFGELDNAPEVRELVAATVAAEQCRSLHEHGISDFHFYTMNRAGLTEATCRILGLSAHGVTSEVVAAS